MYMYMCMDEFLIQSTPHVHVVRCVHTILQWKQFDVLWDHTLLPLHCTSVIPRCTHMLYIVMLWLTNYYLNCQMRSYQYDTLPSDWSDPVPVEFTLLKKPTPVEGIRVDFTDVEIVYGVTPDCRVPPCVKVFVRVRWSAIQLRGQAVLERYNLIINNDVSFNPVVSTN